MSKFQVGDIVVVKGVAGDEPYSTLKEGCIATINNTLSARAYYDYELFFKGVSESVFESEIEHLKVKATNISKAFHKGNIIKEENGYLLLRSKR